MITISFESERDTIQIYSRRCEPELGADLGVWSPCSMPALRKVLSSREFVLVSLASALTEMKALPWEAI